VSRSGKSIPLYEDGQMQRDFVFIDDVALAVQAALRSKQSGLIVDIGSGRATTIAFLAQLIAQRYGAPESHVCGKFRNGDVRHASCILRKDSELNWGPSVPLEKGVNLLCEWIDEALERTQKIRSPS
jgi:dTDP-L-rhamnose 4-epimerase